MVDSELLAAGRRGNITRHEGRRRYRNVDLGGLLLADINALASALYIERLDGRRASPMPSS